MFNILVIEDDIDWISNIGTRLRRDGYNIVSAGNTLAAQQLLDDVFVDLCIASTKGSDRQIYTFLESLKKSSYQYLPIIVISTSHSFTEMETAFNMGADDYMIKPFNLDELSLRVRALLRRASIMNERKIQIGSTMLNFDTLTLVQNGEETLLPKKEFMLLYMLVSSMDKIFGRHQIMDEIWGYDNESDEKTINVHINRLREKLKNNKDIEIKTVRGMGYKAVLKNK